MSIIEDVFARAGLTEVKVEDLRPGDRFILREPEEDAIYEGIVGRIDGDILLYRVNALALSIHEEQTWYLVERAPVEEPTRWGAVVEVNGVKYARVVEEDEEPWAAQPGDWCSWEEIIQYGIPKILFDGISE